MSEPWLETWEPKEVEVIAHQWGTQTNLTINAGTQEMVFIVDGCVDVLPRENIVLAAPEMCRGLLAVEHSVKIGDCNEQCPACGYCWMPGSPHDETCPIDIALDKCGLDTQEKRDAARAKIKEMGL